MLSQSRPLSVHCLVYLDAISQRPNRSILDDFLKRYRYNPLRYELAKAAVTVSIPFGSKDPHHFYFEFQSQNPISIC